MKELDINGKSFYNFCATAVKSLSVYIVSLKQVKTSGMLTWEYKVGHKGAAAHTDKIGTTIKRLKGQQKLF